MKAAIGNIAVCRTKDGKRVYIGICKAISGNTYTFDLISTTDNKWDHTVFTWDRKYGNAVKWIGPSEEYPEYMV